MVLSHLGGVQDISDEVFDDPAVLNQVFPLKCRDSDPFHVSKLTLEIVSIRLLNYLSRISS